MPSVNQVIGYLTAKGIRADRGYPGTPMPHITAMAVAVNVQKSEPAAVTYKATVCIPRAKGALCTWGESGFDETMGVYAVTVYGRWEAPTVPEE